MGIKGIYADIGPGQRIALSKLAVETYECKGRPFRLAIDISIWLFQIQSSKGGTNPALRTFYYRLLRLISLSIHPLFVFDGPNKPPFKRNRRTGPNVASIPEFLAKQLLKQFGLPFHIAPGEAEAECALLQRRGIVDAVLSEDVDTLMFGSGLTLRNWSAEGTLKGKTATHVNVYDAKKTKADAGLDREAMILVALMSGGDYVPEGIPGCGPKTACQAARAGFGKDLCDITKDDDEAFAAWKDRLKHELVTNESGFFQRRSKALVIPDDFPRRDILRYYTHPCLSSDERLEKLKNSLKWDQAIDFNALRTFTAEAFEWICLGGAKKFIRNLAPALLVRQLRLMGESGAGFASDDPEVIAMHEARLVKTIHLRRNHVTTDGLNELRVAFLPLDLVPIDLSVEDPDPELPMDGLESDEELTLDHDPDGADEPVSPKKKRGPSTYDPSQFDKVWILESFVKVGVPLKVQDWEESLRRSQKCASKKSRSKAPTKPRLSPKKSRSGGMQVGSLDPFTTSTKPGMKLNVAKADQAASELFPNSQRGDLTGISTQIDMPSLQSRPSLAFNCSKSKQPSIVNLLSSSPPKPRQSRSLGRSHSDTSTLRAAPWMEAMPSSFMEPIVELPCSVTKRKPRGALRRAQTIADTNSSPRAPPSDRSFPLLGEQQIPSGISQNSCSASSADLCTTDLLVRPASPSPTPNRKERTPEKQKVVAPETISLLSSSPMKSPSTPRHRQRSIVDWLSPSPSRPQQETISLHQPNGSVAVPHHTSPLTSPQGLPDPFLDPRKCTAYSSTPRQALCTSSENNLNAMTSAADVVGDTEPKLKEFRLPRNISPPLEKSLPTVPKKAIRVRKSLAGAWAFVDDEDLGASATETPQQAGRRKRKAVEGRDETEKRWRISQVEVLDLTGL